MKSKCVLSTVDGDGNRHEVSSEGDDLVDAITYAAEARYLRNWTARQNQRQEALRKAESKQ